MKWLTQKEIKAAAKKGPITAIKCCIKHWEQMLKATPRELKIADGAYKVSPFDKWCACCIRYKGNCEKCPLWGGKYIGNCAPEWSYAKNALDVKMRNKLYSISSIADFINYLKEKLQQLQTKNKRRKSCKIKQKF